MHENLKTAFVSRQYMLSEDFEIYYYNDRHMPKMKDHTHDYYEFYFFIEGDVSVKILDRDFNLKEGDVVLIPPGVRHHIIIHSQDKPYRRFVFWLSKKYYKKLRGESGDYGYMVENALKTGHYISSNDTITFNGIQSKVFAIIEEMNLEHFGREEKISLCIRDMLLHLNRIVYEKSHPRKINDTVSLYDSVVRYIEEHLEEELSLLHLSEQFFISRYYLAHMFKEHMGISVHQYILKKRLAACRDAIRSGSGINEVCHYFGFRDYSGFYRAFKKEYGLSPKEYKTSLSKIPGIGKQEQDINPMD